VRFEVRDWRGFLIVSPLLAGTYGYSRAICLGWYRKT
jgi:hypothetical protein